MCRKSFLQGCCMIAFGFGLLIGFSLKNWVLCCGGGVVLMILGLCMLKRR